MWTVNFQMFKLVLEKAEEPEINLQPLLNHRKSKRVPEKHLLLLYWLCQTVYVTVWTKTNWKILKEMGIPDHLTCLLRNLYADQEAAVRIRHGTTNHFQIGKGVHQGCILLPSYHKFIKEFINMVKTIALTRQTFLGKIMSLLFNKVSRLVITFLSRNKHL